MRSRPFLLRLTLAALGMFVVCLIAFVGGGLFLRAQPERSTRILGESRFHRLVLGYLRVLRACYPKDSDGDSIPDLVEIFLHQDPRNPGRHPRLVVRQDLGLVLTNSHRWPHSILWPRVPVVLGKPQRVHGWAGFYDEGGVFAPCLRLVLEAPPGTLLGLPGGEISNAKLQIPVAADGAVVFDLTTTVDPGPAPSGMINAFHAFSHERAGVIELFVVSALPSFTAEAMEIPPEDPERKELLLRAYHREGSEYEHVVRVTWPDAVRAAAGPGGSIAVEVTCDEKAEEWI